MVNGVQRLDERGFDQVELLERQAALVELTIQELLHRDIIDQVWMREEWAQPNTIDCDWHSRRHRPTSTRLLRAFEVWGRG